MKLGISFLDHAGKLKFNTLICTSAIYKQNVSIWPCLSNSVQYGRGLYFQHGLCISALKRARKFTFGLLVSVLDKTHFMNIAMLK